MKTISPALKLLLNLTTAQSVVSRRFDGRLNSLGLTEFLILLQLEQNTLQKMRRIDLAELVGLTASGVTRLLAPMEKIGLIEKEANAKDARVSLVCITKAGKRALQESLENAEDMATRLLQHSKIQEIDTTSNILQQLGGSIM